MMETKVDMGFDPQIKDSRNRVVSGTGFYNKKRKEDFLSTLDQENTRNSYATTLRLVAEVENTFEKDFLEFNSEQFKEAIINCSCKSVNSLRNRYSAMQAYELWGKEHNLLGGRQPNTVRYTINDLKQYIKKVDAFISEEQLYDEIIPLTTRENYQDALPFLLIFKGMFLEELCDLKVEDIDFENKVINVKNFKMESHDGKLEEVETIRKIYLSEVDIEIVKKALEQRIYKKGENEDPDKKNYSPTLPLAINDYVIRKGRKRRSTTHIDDDAYYNIPVGRQVITNRIVKYKNKIGKRYLTFMTIHQSGMIDMLEKIQLKNGTLTPEDYKSVHKYYGKSEDNWYTLLDTYLTNYLGITKSD